MSYDRVTETYWIIEPKLWSMTDNLKAQNEGWMIILNSEPHIASTGTHVAIRPFSGDIQAREWVAERARQGSAFHEKALIALMKASLHGAEDL